MTNDRRVIASTKRLELFSENGHYIISDDWNTDMIIFYDHVPEWSCDGKFFINWEECPRAIRDVLDRLAGRAYNATTERYGTMLRIYDIGTEAFDRYTIIPPKSAKEYFNINGSWDCLAASERPYHPQGFGTMTTALPGNHLGKRISWDKLPDDVQDAAREFFPEWAPVSYRGNR